MQSFQAIYLRVNPAKISLLRFLLEGYDGLAILSTLDIKQGLIRMLVHETRTKELWNFLKACSVEFNLAVNDLDPVNANVLQ